MTMQRRVHVLLVAAVLFLAASQCGPEPQLFQQHDVYYFDLADVYGEVVWNGVLDRERVIMYSAFEAPGLPLARTYYEIFAIEYIEVEYVMDDQNFRGTGLKLLEVKEPPAASPDFAALERTLLDRLQISRDEFVGRDPYGSFELLISTDLANNFNLYQENLNLQRWYGWAGDDFSPGKLHVWPLSGQD